MKLIRNGFCKSQKAFPYFGTRCTNKAHYKALHPFWKKIKTFKGTLWYGIDNCSSQRQITFFPLNPSWNKISTKLSLLHAAKASPQKQLCPNDYMRNLTRTNKSNHTAVQLANMRHIFFHHHKCLWLHRLSQNIHYPELQTLTGTFPISHIITGNIIKVSGCWNWDKELHKPPVLCSPYFVSHTDQHKVPKRFICWFYPHCQSVLFCISSNVGFWPIYNSGGIV